MILINKRLNQFQAAMAIDKLLILTGVLIIINAIKSTRAETFKNSFDPEDVEYFKEIGIQIANFMCRHFDEVMESLNITKKDLF